MSVEELMTLKEHLEDLIAEREAAAKPAEPAPAAPATVTNPTTVAEGSAA